MRKHLGQTLLCLDTGFPNYLFKKIKIFHHGTMVHIWVEIERNVNLNVSKYKRFLFEMFSTNYCLMVRNVEIIVKPNLNKCREL